MASSSSSGPGMPRRDFLRTIGVGAATLGAPNLLPASAPAGAARGAPARGARPNILLVMTDQHDPAIAGFAGDPVVHTRHLDALARQSVRFTAAACTAPACTPSRMSMLTAKEVHRCAGWGNHWIIFPEHVTWPGHFAAHGYRTCLVGKMHYGGRDQMQGFQDRPYGDLRHGLGHQPDPLAMFPGYAGPRSGGVSEVPESLMQDVVVTRETLAYVLEHEAAGTGQPWFVCASYGRPHSPYTAPGRYLRRYRDRVPPPPDGGAVPDEPLAAKVAETYRGLQPDEIRRGREGYYAALDFVDDCIGELLDGLRKQGLLENTIVIYTSDHGEMLGNHGLWAKTVYYQRSVGVPLLLSGPGIAAGAHEVAHPVSLMDLFPTTCELAGLPVPEGLDGRSLAAVLAAPAAAPAPHEAVLSAYYLYGAIVSSPHNPPPKTTEPNRAWRSARSARWKYVEIEGGRPLLFDLAQDPGETTNLAGRPEHAGVCAAHRAIVFRDFSWEGAKRQLAADRARVPQFKSGRPPSTPNQYRLPDGREFDAEAGLYGARWLTIPPGADGGIIPQQFG
ncbi:MAG: sulfatase-like hydrolase/transferase [Opitutaceae bacterium]|nr:sulfatase-like hydrolase/transferase [Opitutaceae bacterium]